MGANRHEGVVGAVGFYPRAKDPSSLKLPEPLARSQVHVCSDIAVWGQILNATLTYESCLYACHVLCRMSVFLC